jgi:aldose 1-epimerase
VDETLIPTGSLLPVDGTPFDFRQAMRIGERIRDMRDQQIAYGRGYDHNYALNGASGALRLAARLEDPASGRVLELMTDQPGLQVYTGNFLDGTVSGKSQRAYRQGDGLALEPQLFPDTPNQPKFGSARLAPGQTYRNHMIFRLLTDAR